MKAQFVKGYVFVVVFSFSRAILRGRGGHGWLANRRFAFSSLWFLFFVVG